MFISRNARTDLRPARMAKSIVAALAVVVLAFLVAYGPPHEGRETAASIPPSASAGSESQAGDVFVPTQIEIDAAEVDPTPPTF